MSIQPYSQRVSKALTLMYELHSEQYRKGGGIPYITHLLAVASLVGEFGADEDTFIAALLHDAAEDQGGDSVLVRIETEFGGRVAELVAGASDTFESPKPAWRPRKEKHIARMRKASPELRLILCADKIHNARALTLDLETHGARYWEHFNGGREGTLWYYRESAIALSDNWEHPILKLLVKEVSALECAATSVGV